MPGRAVYYHPMGESLRANILPCPYGRSSSARPVGTREAQSRKKGHILYAPCEFSQKNVSGMSDNHQIIERANVPRVLVA